MNEHSKTHSVVVERSFAYAPEKVWRALTEGPLLEDWLMKNDFRPIAGHRFTFRTSPMPHWDGILTCEVLDVRPHEHLSYTWNTSGEGLKTVITWTLTKVDGGTHLRMEQSGFRSQDDLNYKGAVYGWQRNFGELDRVVAGLQG